MAKAALVTMSYKLSSSSKYVQKPVCQPWIGDAIDISDTQQGPISSAEASYQKTEGPNQNLRQILNSETSENLELRVDKLEDELRPARCGHARLWSQPVPYREQPPRRKVVWIWVCCCCGNGGMKVSVDPCPYCGIPRCPNCGTQRYNTR
ncbi:hypothetical protein BKA59DRAFT_71877 [Fusarium tricinctum]|uniref:Uncharacterized protein n=1 Tax=Fusarium tricinctum TaxID=61284 RepID=A0A8K0S7L4_9HYPO|nr:hypothetical protein BKA59DRAFT_71877 [Fusarium tricinctum]